MDRRGYIGSSDIAAILGISPWKTPYQLWLEKTSEQKPEDFDSPVLKRGRRVEPYICELLEQDRGVWIVDRNVRVQHPEYDFLWAESDFTYAIDDEPLTGLANLGHGECKSVGWNGEGWGPEGSQEVPPYYLAQVYFALACNGLREATVAAAFSYDELRTCRFESEPEIQAELVKQAVNFWNNHVLAGVPPPAKTLEDSKLILERFSGFTWEASEEASAIAQVIRQYKDQAKTALALANEHEKAFLDLMITAASVHGVTPEGTKNFKAIGPDGKSIATYSTITRKGYTVGETTYKQLRWGK
jgi:putative phage-type endonuclease